MKFNSPDFIVDPGGQVFPVPKGATGPNPSISPTSGKVTGSSFTGGSGGSNGQVSTMRIMDPVAAKGKVPAYPDGYIKYENSASPRAQAVNPVTGKTDSKPNTHYPIKSRK